MRATCCRVASIFFIAVVCWLCCHYHSAMVAEQISLGVPIEINLFLLPPLMIFNSVGVPPGARVFDVSPDFGTSNQPIDWEFDSCRAISYPVLTIIVMYDKRLSSDYFDPSWAPFPSPNALQSGVKLPYRLLSCSHPLSQSNQQRSRGWGLISVFFSEPY